MVGPSKSRPPMSHRKTDLGIPCRSKSAKVVLVLQVGVGSAVSASLARQIENAVDCPDRVEGAGVAALERHLARPVVVDPVLIAREHVQDRELLAVRCF